MSLLNCCCSCVMSFPGHFFHGCWPNAGEAGDTITVTDHSTGTVYWTGTTAADGSFSASFDSPSGVTSLAVDVTGTGGGDTLTVTRTVHCGTNTTVTLQVVKLHVVFHSYGCNGLGVDGVLVDVTGPVSASCTTSGSFVGAFGGGTCTVDLPAGSYTWTATGSRWATASGAFTITSCTAYNVDDPAHGTMNVSITMTPASGYDCICGWAYPVPTTLNGSWNGGGTFTLSPGAVAPFGWVSPDFNATFPGTVEASDCCTGGPPGLPQTVDAKLQICVLHPDDTDNALLFQGNSGAVTCPDAGETFYTARYGLSDLEQLQTNADGTHQVTIAYTGTPSAFAMTITFDYQHTTTGGINCRYGGVLTITE